MADSDFSVCDDLRLLLRQDGYTALTAHDGASCLRLFKNEAPDLLVLDAVFSDASGLEILREIRRISRVPIIMIGENTGAVDRIVALEIGADDYLIKPFDQKELLARIHAVLRRYGVKPVKDEKTLVFSGLTVNLNDYSITIGGKKQSIPPKELELLYFLASNPNSVFSRDQLLDKVWGFDYFGDTRTVDVHIKRLREKFKNVQKNWSIKTVYGVGYQFETL